MNETGVAERIRISFFGRRNAGKSSLINAVTNQNLAIVSQNPGTTTDPVSKTMELLPLGPVILTDTAGIDDEGELGKLRIEKTFDVLKKTDIGIIVCDIHQRDFLCEQKIIDMLNKSGKPYIIAINKDDEGNEKKAFEWDEKNAVYVSAVTGYGIEKLKNKIGSIKIRETEKTFLEGIAEENRIIVLVCPIDGSAPKGRLIMPQVMAIRDILDKKGICITVQPSQLEDTLRKITPYMVITDSQAFGQVRKIVPDNIYLTGFSVLMSKYKSDIYGLIRGAETVDSLEDGDRILIAEACTHHAQKNDIGRIQIPEKLRKYTGKKLEFEFISGGSFPEDLSPFRLIVHCGGCMITETFMKYRQKLAQDNNVPMTNYGIVLAKISGILDRVTGFLDK
ncbi:MAG: [FeFe] hydrogenase H-cluster maturation GTPase HydF [Armatimonadetes bacterium]|nr:[FeFe] hydrogenase H-cluster maturation GTPase HydF [Candidatus Hippobium faecium]